MKCPDFDVELSWKFRRLFTDRGRVEGEGQDLRGKICSDTELRRCLSKSFLVSSQIERAKNAAIAEQGIGSRDRIIERLLLRDSQAGWQHITKTRHTTRAFENTGVTVTGIDGEALIGEVENTDGIRSVVRRSTCSHPQLPHAVGTPASH